MGKEITGIASEFYVLSMLLRKGADATFSFLFTTIILKTFLCFLKFLLGLVLIVLVFSGCQNPSRLEIPEGAEVEFVWGASPQVSNSISGDKQAYSHLYRYFLDLHEEEKDK